MLLVDSHSGADGFRLLRQEWIQLEQRAAEDNIFLTHLWQHAWWEELGGGGALDLVAFRDGGRLVGVAPTYKEQLDGHHAVRFGGGLEVTDYLGLIIEVGYEEAVGEAFLRHCLKDPEVLLDFHFLRSDGVTLRALRAAAVAIGVEAREEVEEVSPRIELMPTWDEYLAGLSKKDRHELRRKRRRLEEAGGWTLHETTPKTLEQDLEVFFTLHAKSTRAKADFLTPAVGRFFEHVADHIQQAGWLRLTSLRCQDKPVASVLGFDYSGRLMLYNSGYDPEYNNLSVGFVLMSELIRLAIEGGRTEVDFLRGNEKYKYDLGAADVPLLHLSVAAR